MKHRYLGFIQPIRGRRDLVLFALGAALIMPLLWTIESLLDRTAQLLGWTTWCKSLGAELLQIWDTVSRGGIVMLIIMSVALWMVMLTIRQLLTLRIAEDQLTQYLNEISHGLEPNWEMLKRKTQTGGLMSAVVLNIAEFKFLNDYSILSDLLDRAVADACHRFDQQTDRIRFLASAAPRLGLLGTVLGMIVAFHALDDGAASSSERSALIANGLAMALGPTTIGLILGIAGDKTAQVFETAIATKRILIEQAMRPLLMHWCSTKH